MKKIFILIMLITATIMFNSTLILADSEIISDESPLTVKVGDKLTLTRLDEKTIEVTVNTASFYLQKNDNGNTVYFKDTNLRIEEKQGIIRKELLENDTYTEYSNGIVWHDGRAGKKYALSSYGNKITFYNSSNFYDTSNIEFNRFIIDSYGITIGKTNIRINFNQSISI